MSKELEFIDMFDPDKPHDSLAPLPPSAELEGRAVLKANNEARAALGELKAAVELLPDSSMLINTIPLLEAKDSSEIENILTTTDRLFQASSMGLFDSDPATKETVRYRTALRVGVESLQRGPLRTATAIEVCTVLRGVDVEIRRVPGTKLTNGATGEVVYTPPSSPEVLHSLMSNWERFLHDESSDLDPVVRMAAAHYQFEAIHPFTDGNGRTGRILNVLYLVASGLISTPVLYASREIMRSKDEYYARLLAVTTHAEWEQWLVYMIRGLAVTARWTNAKIAATRRLFAHTTELIRARAARLYSYELVEVIFTQPYCRIADLVDAGVAKRQTASRYLQVLCELGVLEERKVGRDKLYVHLKLLDLLTADHHEFDRYAET